MKIEELSNDDIIQSIHSCRKWLFDELFPLLNKTLQQRLKGSMGKTVQDFIRGIPTFYCLIKIHKPTLRGRPIISCTTLPFGPVSSYVGWRLNNILKRCGWLQEHLVRTSLDVVKQFEGKQLGVARNQWIGVAFDLVELYPSLPTDSSVLDLIYDFLSHWDIPDRQHLIRLIEFLFHYTWFSFRGRFYHQISGLAMGHSHSPPLANLLVYLLLEKRMKLNELTLPFYCQYLDDGGMIIDGTLDLVKQLFFY